MVRFWMDSLIGAGFVVAMASVAMADSATFQPAANTPREDVPEQYRWQLESYFSSVTQWEDSFAKVTADIPTVALCKGKLVSDSGETLACLNRVYQLKARVAVLETYAFQWWSTNMLDEAAQSLKERASALSTSLSEVASFVNPELQAIPTADWNRMVAEASDLKQYNLLYQDLKRREEHLLDAKAESILALTGPMREGPYNIFSTLTQEIPIPPILDESGTEVEIGFATFSKYRGSKDREVRKRAVETFFASLKKFENALATSLATSVRGAVFEARARGYSSSLEMALDADAVPVAMYKNLIGTTGQNLPRTLHRYVALRKRLMGLEDIHYYDMYSPLFGTTEASYSYEAATHLVADSLSQMGDDFLTILKTGMDPASGWTDVYPNRGKRGGAYCTAAYGVHPFVLLNYMNTLDDVFTTAHEFGHAMHYFLSHQAQPFPTADAPIFLAEIASTFQEEMLLYHMLSKAQTKEERLVLLNKRVENIRLTITRQTMFAEFEMLVHEEMERTGSLPAARMNDIYRSLVTKYFGPEFTVDEHDHMEWAYIPHFYYNFYVYKYSTGLMAAIVFADRVQQKKPGAVQQFLTFLASGGSDYPLDILMNSGIDFTSPEIVQATYDLFARTLDEMEKLLK